MADSKVNCIVRSKTVSIDKNGTQIVTLTLEYKGAENLDSKITVNENLSIEIPTHAPPQ